MGAVVWARPGDGACRRGPGQSPAPSPPAQAGASAGPQRPPWSPGSRRPQRRWGCCTLPHCPCAGGSPTTPRARAAQDSRRPAGATPTAPQHPPLYLSTPLHPEHPTAPQHPHCTSLGTSRGAPGIYLRSWLDKLGQAWAQSGGVLGADAPQLSLRGHTDPITAKPGWRALQPQSVSLPSGVTPTGSYLARPHLAPVAGGRRLLHPWPPAPPTRPSLPSLDPASPHFPAPPTPSLHVGLCWPGVR